jgi:hypothetical protein
MVTVATGHRYSGTSATCCDGNGRMTVYDRHRHVSVVIRCDGNGRVISADRDGAIAISGRDDNDTSGENRRSEQDGHESRDHTGHFRPPWFGAPHSIRFPSSVLSHGRLPLEGERAESTKCDRRGFDRAEN